MGDITSTFYLYAKPSFIEGMGRVLDLGGNLEVYNESKTAKEADKIAISNDWRAVGNDIMSSIDKYEQKQ
jgi:hypothetical protein